VLKRVTAHQGQEPGQSSNETSARGTVIVPPGLEQLLAPANLIPAGPLVPARRLVSPLTPEPVCPSYRWTAARFKHGRPVIRRAPSI
jgi:hypothetical protein